VNGDGDEEVVNDRHHQHLLLIGEVSFDIDDKPYDLFVSNNNDNNDEGDGMTLLMMMMMLEGY